MRYITPFNFQNLHVTPFIFCKQWKHYIKGWNKQQLCTWVSSVFLLSGFEHKLNDFYIAFLLKIVIVSSRTLLEENGSYCITIIEHLKCGFWWHKGLVLSMWCTSHGEDSIDKQKSWEKILQMQKPWGIFIIVIYGLGKFEMLFDRILLKFEW